MEDALVEYGRWILVHIFGDDAAAALDTKSENPLWTALLARAGGPTLRMSRKVLYVAVEIAARDKRINDDMFCGFAHLRFVGERQEELFAASLQRAPNVVVDAFVAGGDFHGHVEHLA